jgi:hypothetical protein
MYMYMSVQRLLMAWGTLATCIYNVHVASLYLVCAHTTRYLLAV